MPSIRRVVLAKAMWASEEDVFLLILIGKKPVLGTSYWDWDTVYGQRFRFWIRTHSK